MTEANDEYDAHVLILGGSFTGVELVRLLRKHRRGRALEILVVDRRRSHPYIPLGHELLTQRMALGEGPRTLLPSDRYVEAKPLARWVQGEIVGFDPATHTVTLADGRRFSARFVVLVHAGARLLPGLTPRAGRKAAAALQAQGVELLLDTRLLAVDDSHATIQGPQGERTIPCDLSFWAAGLQPPAIIDGFAGGDIARVHGGTGRWPTMQRAIESIFAAQTLAANILTFVAP